MLVTMNKLKHMPYLVWNWSYTPWVTINKNIAKEILPVSPKTQQLKRKERKEK